MTDTSVFLTSLVWLTAEPCAKTFKFCLINLKCLQVRPSVLFRSGSGPDSPLPRQQLLYSELPSDVCAPPPLQAGGRAPSEEMSFQALVFWDRVLSVITLRSCP